MAENVSNNTFANWDLSSMAPEEMIQMLFQETLEEANKNQQKPSTSTKNDSNNEKVGIDPETIAALASRKTKLDPNLAAELYSKIVKKPRKQYTRNNPEVQKKPVGWRYYKKKMEEMPPEEREKYMAEWREKWRVREANPEYKLKKRIWSMRKMQNMSEEEKAKKRERRAKWWASLGPEEQKRRKEEYAKKEKERREKEKVNKEKKMTKKEQRWANMTEEERAREMEKEAARKNKSIPGSNLSLNQEEYEEIMSNDSLPALSTIHSENSCKICGRDVVGLHYGVQSCPKCAKHFQDTRSKNLTYVCKKKGNCPIIYVPKAPLCKACRYQKCLDMGMSETAKDRLEVMVVQRIWFSYGNFFATLVDLHEKQPIHFLFASHLTQKIRAYKIQDGTLIRILCVAPHGRKNKPEILMISSFDVVTPHEIENQYIIKDPNEPTTSSIQVPTSKRGQKSSVGGTLEVIAKEELDTNGFGEIEGLLASGSTDEGIIKLEPMEEEQEEMDMKHDSTFLTQPNKTHVNPITIVPLFNPEPKFLPGTSSILNFDEKTLADRVGASPIVKRKSTRVSLEEEEIDLNRWPFKSFSEMVESLEQQSTAKVNSSRLQEVESNMLEQAVTVNVDEMAHSFTESNQVALPIPIFSSRLQPSTSNSLEQQKDKSLFSDIVCEEDQPMIQNPESSLQVVKNGRLVNIPAARVNGKNVKITSKSEASIQDLPDLFSTITSSKNCVVCGRKNANQNFGVQACAVCAKVFHDMESKKMFYVCPTGNKCLVRHNPGMPLCKACQYQKCLDLGMSYDKV